MYTGVLLFLLFCYSIQGNARIMRNNIKHDRVSDYAIQVKGLPRDGISLEQVKTHFEKFGEVVDAYLGRRYNGLLSYFNTRSVILTKLATRDSLLTFKGKNKEKDSQWKHLNKRLNTFDEKIIQTSNDFTEHDKLPIKTAYIIFNSREDKAKCLKAYNRSCCFRYEKSLLFKGKKLKVFPAPEPSDII